MLLVPVQKHKYCAYTTITTTPLLEQSKQVKGTAVIADQLILNEYCTALDMLFTGK